MTSLIENNSIKQKQLNQFSLTFGNKTINN